MATVPPLDGVDSDALDRAWQPVFRWADRAPDAIAMVDPDHTLTYREFADAIADAAARLTRHGVRAGDRLLIVGENTVSTVIFFFAAEYIEAWPAITNARMTAHEIGVMRATVGARLVVFAIEHSEAAAGHAALEPVTEEASSLWGRVLVGRADPASRPPPAVPLPVAAMIFTSGTTGKPKAALLGHKGLLFMGRTTARTRGATAADAFYGTPPMAHVMGILVLMMVVLTGARLKLVPRLELSDLAASIRDGSTSYITCVPTVYSRLLDYAASQGLDLSPNGIRMLVSGGAPLDPNLKVRVEKAFGCRLSNGYGLTESTPVLTTRVTGPDAPAESVGHPYDGVEVRVVGADGRDVPLGESGEIWIRSPANMLGYFEQPDETAKVMRDGWYMTGDLARQLPDGQVAIVGRAKEMIIRSGFNVYPAEVEAAINAHPAVVQSAVVSRREDDGNEAVVAYVQLAAGETRVGEPELRRHLVERLAPYKRPEEVVILASLPIGPTGKVWKQKLRDMAANARA